MVWRIGCASSAGDGAAHCSGVGASLLSLTSSSLNWCRETSSRTKCMSVNTLVFWKKLTLSARRSSRRVGPVARNTVRHARQQVQLVCHRIHSCKEQQAI